MAAIATVLAGCGGGGGSSTTPTTPTTVVATAATVQLLASNSQIGSSGTTTLDLTAVVLDANRQALAGRTVVFSSGSDPTAFINNISVGGVSDANGIVTAKLNIGGNKTNRTMTVTVTVDGVSASNSIDVTGTTITVSGSNALAFGAATPLIFSVKDSAGTALPGITVAVSSQTGNGIAPATGTTDAAGQFIATVTATKGGNDVVTASAAGAGVKQAIAISSDSFTFTTPTLAAGATSIDIPLNTPTPVAIKWTFNSAPKVGQLVTFTTSRGTVTGSPAVTNAQGNTTGVTVQSSSATGAGPAIITASGPSSGGPAATLNVIFVATTATNVTVQAVPGTVAFTTGSASQTNNSSTISVLVRDGSNNLVKNAAVSFGLSDITGGRLTSSTVLTDVSGSASVTYVAGTTSSAANGVVVTATVSSVNGVTLGASVTGSTTLTVAGQSLLVRLGTDNLTGGAAPINTKTYVATVTDAAGNPVVGQSVRFALRPAGYAKGRWTVIGTAWSQKGNFLACNNEDLNFNGILEFGEDANLSGSLDPGGVATVNASGTTDAAGNATATLTYPKDHSYWTVVTLEARAGVVGNDPPTTATFYLPGPSTDYSNPAVSPPGELSPYGIVLDCSNTL